MGLGSTIEHTTSIPTRYEVVFADIAGAKVNEVDNGHRTALHYAVEANDVDMVNLLLSTKGIDVNIRDDDAQNPLDLVQASTPEGNEISELLTKKDAVHGQGPFSSI